MAQWSTVNVFFFVIWYVAKWLANGPPTYLLTKTILLNGRQYHSLWYELVNLLQWCLSIFFFYLAHRIDVDRLALGHIASTAPIIIGWKWCGSTNIQQNTYTHTQNNHRKENRPENPLITLNIMLMTVRYISHFHEILLYSQEWI